MSEATKELQSLVDEAKSMRHTVREMTETITTAEPIHVPQQATPMPTETPDQRMERLAKELDEWCRKNGVVIEPVAIGRKTGRLANIADWEPDSHIFSHALAPRQQQ